MRVPSTLWESRGATVECGTQTSGAREVFTHTYMRTEQKGKADQEVHMRVGAGCVCVWGGKIVRCRQGICRRLMGEKQKRRSEEDRTKDFQTWSGAVRRCTHSYGWSPLFFAPASAIPETYTQSD